MIFGPRWIFALPLGLLVPLALVYRRGLLFHLWVIGLVILGPMMGFSFSLRGFLKSQSPTHDIRVISYNMGGGDLDFSRFNRLLEETQPHIVALQECDLSLEQLRILRSTWQVESGGEMCLISTFPIQKTEPRPTRDIHKLGGSGAIVRYTLKSHLGTLYFVNLHLETPREGIEAVLDYVRGQPARLRRRFSENGEVLSDEGVSKAADLIDDEIFMRDYESRKAREWVDQTPHPLLISGDFNLPVDSRIYQTYWSEYTNAFAEAGWGLGLSKQTQWFGIRIDHILTGPEWEPLRAGVGPDLGGDHRPVIADFRWTGTTT